MERKEGKRLERKEGKKLERKEGKRLESSNLSSYARSPSRELMNRIAERRAIAMWNLIPLNIEHLVVLELVLLL